MRCPTAAVPSTSMALSAGTASADSDKMTTGA
jgi:hypothetical protein